VASGSIGRSSSSSSGLPALSLGEASIGSMPRGPSDPRSLMARPTHSKKRTRSDSSDTSYRKRR
jgi:hypothetical protein